MKNKIGALLMTLCLLAVMAAGAPPVSALTAGSLALADYTVPSVRAGGTVSLRIRITNAGKTAYRNVTVALDGFSSSGLALNGTANRKNIGTVESGKTVAVDYKLLCSSAASSGYYPLEVSATAEGFEDSYALGSVFVQVRASSASSGDDRDEPLGALFTVPENALLPTIQAGTSGTVAIPLKCTSLSNPGQAQISVGPLPANISFATAGAVYTMDFNGGDTKDLKLGLTADKNLAAGIYGIPLKVSYKFYDNVETKVRIDEITAYIKVLESDSSASGGGKLEIAGYQLDRAPVREGQRFQMTVTVRNNSDSGYRNVRVDLGSLSSEAIAMNGELNTRVIPSVKKGESQNVVFSLICNPKMATGNYQLTINLAAEESTSSGSGDSNASAQSAAASVFIPVVGTVASKTEEDTNASKPQIIIDNYDFGGMSVTGGHEFPLKMNFRNTSPSYGIENLKMVIDSVPDGDNSIRAFTPAKSSNTLFVAKVAPGQPFSWNIDLFPKADAEPKSYGIEISYTYEAIIEGVRKSDLSGKETITIPLTQPDRFELAGAELPGPINLGEQGNLSINYVNKGKSKVFNLSVKLEGNFTSGDMDAYVGNVDSGSGDSFSTMLTPEGPGTLSGKAVFTYEDANGTTKKLEKEFSCEVMEAQPEPQPGPDVPQPDAPEVRGAPAWLNWSAAAFGTVCTIAALIVLGKMVKKRNQRLIDEADDFDDGE